MGDYLFLFCWYFCLWDLHFFSSQFVINERLFDRINLTLHILCILSSHFCSTRFNFFQLTGHLSHTLNLSAHLGTYLIDSCAFSECFLVCPFVLMGRESLHHRASIVLASLLKW